MAKISGGVKIQDVGPPLRPKKCFQQLRSGVGPKLTKKLGVKHGYLEEGGPNMVQIHHGLKTSRKLRGSKKGQNSMWGKTRHLERRLHPDNEPAIQALKESTAKPLKLVGDCQDRGVCLARLAEQRGWHGAL